MEVRALMGTQFQKKKKPLTLLFNAYLQQFSIIKEIPAQMIMRGNISGIGSKFTLIFV